MRKAGDVLEDLFRDRFGPRFIEKARSTAGLFSSWAEIADEARPPSGELAKDDISHLASHSRIREFEKGMLLVEADHPGWVQILFSKQQDLLSIARRRFPELDIRNISFCLSREPFTLASIPEANPPKMPAASSADNGNAENKIKSADNGNDSYYDALTRLKNSLTKKRSIKYEQK